MSSPLIINCCVIVGDFIEFLNLAPRGFVSVCLTGLSLEVATIASAFLEGMSTDSGGLFLLKGTDVIDGEFRSIHKSIIIVTFSMSITSLWLYKLALLFPQIEGDEICQMLLK